MRRKLLHTVCFFGCLLLSCLSSHLFAQHVTKIAIPKVKATVIKPAKKSAASTDTATAPTTEDCAKLKDVVNLDLDKKVTGEYVFSLVDKKGNPISTFTLKQFNESLFTDQLKKALSGLCTTAPLAQDDSLYVEGLIAEFTKQKLYDKMLEASLEVNDAAVYAGVMKVFKAMPVYFTYAKAKTDSTQKAEKDPVQLPQKEFTAYSVSIQFQDGFIENIKVLGKVAGSDQMLKFENVYPIPFSTKRDFRVLYRTCLFERTIYNAAMEHNGHVSSCKLSMGDLLFYSQQLAVNNKDYSPKNQVYNATLTEPETEINLEKEQTSKIMELLVFSDLKGIDDNSPNGLIQLELTKKLNFWSNRHRGLGNHFNYGWFNYITPSFSMNKIEDKNRRLVAKYQGSQQQDTTKANTFASTIDLYQYQSFGIGVNLTCATMDVPAWKSTFHVNMGAYFGRSQIEDTLRAPGTDSASFKAVAENNVSHFGVNSFRLVPEVSWQIFPDPRYGFILSQKFIHYSLHSTDIRQVRDSLSYGKYLSSLNGDRGKIDAYSFKKWIGCAEIYAYFKPAEYNQVFFRYRYNWDMGNTKLNFQQVQIGISTYLTHTKTEKTKTTEE